MADSRFHQKRTSVVGDQSVDIGFKRGEVRVRIKPANDRPFTLTVEDAEDLADALDRVLAEQEDDPLS